MISLVVKSLKNPRSAVCKTALMTSADIFKAYCDSVVDSIDPLVSLDFNWPWTACTCNLVFWDNFFNPCAYKVTLHVPSLFNFCWNLHKTSDLFVRQLRKLWYPWRHGFLQFYCYLSCNLILKNKNPRIQAKASMCISRSVPHLVRVLNYLFLSDIHFDWWLMKLQLQVW